MPRLLEQVIRDLRYAARMFRKSPVFTIVALASLMLGIGANTAIFSLIDALVMRELPVKDPHQLVALGTWTPEGRPSGLSYPMFEEIRQNQQVFSGMFAFSGDGISNVEGGGVISPAVVMVVPGNFYSVLGVAPLLGRTITEQDEGARGKSPAHVAVISYGCWQRRFGGDRSILGQTIRVEGKPYTIVGVTPKAFFGLTVGTSPEVTVPLAVAYSPEGLRNRKTLGLEVVARLKEGVEIERAQAQLQALWPSIQEATVPDDWNTEQKQQFFSRRIRVQSAATGTGYVLLRERYARPLFALMGAVSLLLPVACVNLAGLMLARAEARRQEIAVRSALGAGAWCLIRQLLTESVLLSLGGAALGFLLANWTSRALAQFIWTGVVPLELNLGPDGRILGFTTVVALCVGIFFGLVPAWRAGCSAPASALQQSTRAISGGRMIFGKVLISLQVALSLILLVGAGLFARSLVNLHSINTGFNSDGVIVVHLMGRPGAYKNFSAESYYRELLERVSNLPGVSSATLSNLAPVLHVPFEYRESVSANHGKSAPVQISAYRHDIGPHFFKTLGISLLEGRDFDFSDTERKRPVAILSRILAVQLFPSSRAIGRQIAVGTAPEFQNVEVVGIASDANLWNIRKQKQPFVSE